MDKPENILDRFEYIGDISDKIESLIAEAAKIRSKKEKKIKLQEAQDLINAYEMHTGHKVFNKIKI